VSALIEAAAPRLREDSFELRNLLERSKNQLGLPDPLLFDLGVHRWLDKETCYSDWLAWTLQRLDGAREVLRVLGVEDQEFVAACDGQSHKVEREVQVKQGLRGHQGQIDLLIHFGEPLKALLGVEVKVHDEQYEKQSGYIKSLQHFCRNVKCVLVANRDDIPPEQLHEFQQRDWKEVCIALRQVIAGRLRSTEDTAVVSMMLGFVAAIEQNLLDFHNLVARRAMNGWPLLLPKELSVHLRKAIEVIQ
jgi:hypothetical protein